MRLADPLPPLTQRQRHIVWSVAIVCALSRFAARAHSLWDWDEVLFCLGMRSFDVTLHHPHPPGFPVFIALGRLVRLVAGDDFRSLQTISLVAGMLFFPAVFMLARELRLRFETAVIAGALAAFLPNVWFYGGTAFSDVPSIVLVTFASAFLMRGCRERGAFYVGVLLLSLAMGMRPQNALVGVFPFLAAIRHRGWRDAIGGVVLGSVIVIGAFVGAAIATGSFDTYRQAVQAHSEYISEVDSFRSETRPPLWRLAAQFFGKQYSVPFMNFVMSLLVIVSIVLAIRARDRSMLFNALTFAPVAIAAWLFLDRYSVNRFSIGYCPMFAIFAADGVSRLARYKPKFEWGAGAVLVAAFIGYTLPALGVVRSEDAPSVLAMKAAKQHFDPQRHELFVAEDMVPFVDYFLPGVETSRVLDERAMLLERDPNRQPFLIAEIFGTSPEGFVYLREKKRLWNISRRHYYGAAFARVTRLPQFESGWYEPERAGAGRRLATRSVVVLPPTAVLSWLRLRLVADSPAEVSIVFNGRAVDAFRASGDFQGDWRLMPAANGAPNRLEITTSVDRAVRVRRLSWAEY